jgi:formylglycine-generating enzyme required for sulfatase activity
MRRMHGAMVVAAMAVLAAIGSGGAPATPPASAPAGLKEMSVDLGGGVKMDFVLIPAGAFKMGADTGTEADKPAHEVKISEPFWMAKYELTHEQYKAIMGEDRGAFMEPKNPMDVMSWDDAQDVLKKLNAKAGGAAFRLPTEAEWEYACRAGTETVYYFGDDDAQLPEHAWFARNAGGKTHPVGQKKPNAWGLYDMYGNQWEWCQDWLGPYAAEAQTDPKGPDKGTLRVIRGGCWTAGEINCRSATRSQGAPDFRSVTQGMRCVRNAK